MTDRIAARVDEYRHKRESLAFLDCNLWIGQPDSPEFVTDFDLDALRQRMSRYGIKGGIVSHFASVSYGQAWGNARVVEAIKGTALWAGIVLVPEMFYEETDGRAYLAGAISQGARLVRLYPRAHNFSVRAWCAGAMFHALEQSRVPVMVRHVQVSWEDLRYLCESYPHLTIVVEAVEQKILYHNRLFYPLLERYPNLRLELHNFVAYGAVEDVVERFGADRLVFGSYLPICDPNASIMQVTDARFSEEDKSLIARQNLLQLVNGVRRP